MTGGLDFVRKGTKTLHKLKEAMSSAGVAFDEIEREELLAKYPGFSMPENFVCLHSKDAGVVNASKACALFQSLARSEGAALVDNVKVSAIKDDFSGKGLLVETADHGTIKAAKVVVTAGAWNQKLGISLPGGGIDLGLRPINTTIVYWKTKEESDPAVYRKAPVFIVYADDDRVLNAYGTPAIEYPGLVKFCLHSGPDCDPDTRLCVPNLDDIEKSLKGLTKTFLPLADSSQHVLAEA